MSLNTLEKKMNLSLFSTFNIYLSDLTVFEFGNHLNDVMIFIGHYNEDFYYYYPISDKWKINEGWTYFKRDKKLNEVSMASDFRQIYNLSYNDLIYVGNWNMYKKFSNSNYYHFKHPSGVEYLFDKLIGVWTVKIKVNEKQTENKCCCIMM